MKVVGTVVSVEVETQVAKKNGGTYPGAELVYRGNDGKVNTQAWHENAFKYAAEIKTTLQSLKTGDMFEMVKEKDGDFWKVLSIVKTDGSTSTQTPSNTKQWTKPSDDGKWADKAEREANGVRIVRQNALGHAVNLLTLQGEKKATPQQVIDIASQFENWVFGKTVTNNTDEDDVPL